MAPFSNPNAPFSDVTTWPLHDIAVTNIVWQVLQYRIVEGKHYIAQYCRR